MYTSLPGAAARKAEAISAEPGKIAGVGLVGDIPALHVVERGVIRDHGGDGSLRPLLRAAQETLDPSVPHQRL